MSKIDEDIKNAATKSSGRTPPVEKDEQFAIFENRNASGQLINYGVAQKGVGSFSMQSQFFGETISPKDALKLAKGEIIKFTDTIQADGKDKKVTNEVGIGTPALFQYLDKSSGQMVTSKGKRAPLFVATARRTDEGRVFGYKIREDTDSGSEKKVSVSYVLEGRVGNKDSKETIPLSLRNLMDLHEVGERVAIKVSDTHEAWISGFSTPANGSGLAYIAAEPLREIASKEVGGCEVGEPAPQEDEEEAGMSM